MLKKITSIALAFIMIASTFMCLTDVSSVSASAATTNQQNIVDRANYLYNTTWVCQKTISGWRGNYYFYQGSTYRLPYGQPIYSGYYIGYGVSVDDFVASTKNASSVFYTSQSNYDGMYSTYYATDCSAYVSWCWGTSRYTTYSIPQVSTNLGYATTSNNYNLQLGDALNSNDVGHVVLVTGLTYDSSGTITQIEITEQTPPQLKRSYYTPSTLASKYGAYYTIQRYYGTVPASPGGSSSSGSGSSSGSTTVTNGKYYAKCDSSYESFYPAMESIGVSCDWELHQRIAEANGITDFTGTVEQNTQLLNLLKAGTLLNPDYEESIYYPACDSSYTTFYTGMESIGVSCDWELHQRIAAANGITDFSGTAEQNELLLSLLKAGTLINPDASSDDSGSSSGGSSSSGTTTSGKTGYERGYDGGMAGTGTILTKGLDLSSWQEDNVNFSAIKAAGYTYVILRCGTTNGKDTYFETYYSQAKAAGLNVGAYYYVYATSESASYSDASNCLSWISGKTFEYPIYFDYEDSSQSGLSESTAIAISNAFMGTLEDAGYLVGMYSMASWIEQDWITNAGFRDYYEGWVAHYAGDGTYDAGYSKYGTYYSTKYGMYQFTDKHYFTYGGVTYGPYDGDICYKDYPTIVKTYGFNGYEYAGDDEEETTEPTTEPTTTPAEKTFTLKFYPNSGEGTMEDQTITYGTNTKITKNAYTREGFTFYGWRAYRNATEEWFCTDGTNFGWYAKDDIPQGYTYYYFSDEEYVATTGLGEGDVVRMYAVWDGGNYTIKYLANGGSGTMADSTHTYGVHSCVSKNTFTREGYEFAGWYVYRTTVKKYIYSNGEESTGYVKGSQPDGYALKLYDDQFVTSSTCTAKLYTVKLIAQWVPVSTGTKRFAVEYNSNGGSGSMDTSIITYGTATKLSANKFTRENYEFAGWRLHRRSTDKWACLDADGNTVWLTGAEYAAAESGTYTFKLYKDQQSVSKLSSVDCDIVTLYATWDFVEYFNVEFDANGGVGTMDTQKIIYGNLTPISKNKFTKENYKFVGWNMYREATGLWRYTNGTVTNGFYKEGEQPEGYSLFVYTDEQEIYKSGLGTGDTVVLRAVWEYVPYFNIEFDSNGGEGTMADQKVIYGEATTISKNTFTKDGYRFVGWNMYRGAVKKWRYTDGTNFGYYDEGEQPDDYYLYTYTDEQAVSKLGLGEGDTVILRAVWEKDLLIGDVNSDGVVNVSDATQLQKYLVNGTSITGDNKTICDANGDGYINIKDATMIQKYIAGVISSLG